MDSTSDTRGVIDPRAALRSAGIDVQPIPELHLRANERLLDVLSDHGSPVLARGAAKDWPLLERWTPEGLAARLGDIEVTALANLPAKGVLFAEDQSKYEVRVSFSRFVEMMLESDLSAPCYLAYTRIADFVESGDEIDMTALIGQRAGDLPDTRVWIGSAGTRSMLHSDLKDNVFCQIAGQKYVTLLPWSQSRSAYPFSDNLVNSQVDICDPQLKRQPRLAETTFFSSEVGPGDVVYIPKGCWHDMRASTASVSINHWFGEPHKFRIYAWLLLRLGPRYWGATIRDLVLHGVLQRKEAVRFFFSPPSTGKRLWSALRARGFSGDNDPSN